MSSTNYFVCTLGDAALLDQNKSYKTIHEFIDVQARDRPESHAVGFYFPGSDSSKPWKHRILNFRNIQRNTNAVAETLLKGKPLPKRETVALLCPSSATFLFTWLALMRLGYSVLLLAPQCSPSAIAQLCKTCKVNKVFYDDLYENLVARACSNASQSNSSILEGQPLSFVSGKTVFEMGESETQRTLGHPDLKETDVAYVHHTSGTSAGIPKPIPQTYRAAIGILPRLDGSREATFTTTPLYHGGIADLFRAWTSNALIWLFPGKEVPITANNVVKCLDTATKCALDNNIAPVKYFSSVPYVLQMVASDGRGLKYLQSMDIVGVGGAALPDEVGTSMVKTDINLISRFGSAECGFLMSSHRDYVKDKEWQYLRPGKGVDHLRFDQQTDGLSELVILPGWPHMAKKNREDGSFATSDLFAPHAKIPNAWRYHSRADSQVTLITGKKFDPAPLEAAIAAASPFLDSALIFGNGKPYPGALLFRSAGSALISSQDVLAAVTPIIEKLNKESQTHARIPRLMLIAMPYSEIALDKSSKGSILRKNAEERYAEQIESAYECGTVPRNHDVPDDQVTDFILKLVQSIISPAKDHNEEISKDTDLFAYGIDSVTCMQTRQALSQLLARNSPPLPLTSVEDSGTISRLSNLIISLRHGWQPEKGEDQVQFMLELVKQYSSFINPAPIPEIERNQTPESQSVILTGSTGSLGAHILSQLLSHPSISHIYLLLRDSTSDAARTRVIKALYSRSLPIPTTFDSRVTILPVTFSHPTLLLNPATYVHLAGTATTIIHCAWTVNFLQSLRNFGATHLAGLQNLLNLALASSQTVPPRVVFCSSVASVSSYPHVSESGSMVPEIILSDPAVAGPTGYSRSKWVAEQICRTANESSRLRGRVTVVRVGQLAASRAEGVWSQSEAWPLMLASLMVTGVLPDLGMEELNWLPVNEAAQAFVEDVVNDSQGKEVGEVEVLHVVSPHTTTWCALLRMLASYQSFDVVSPREWLKRLASLQEDDTNKDHPAMKLAGFWRNAFGDTPKTGDESPEGKDRKTAAQWRMSKTLIAMPSLADVRPIDDEYVRKLWTWIKGNI